MPGESEARSQNENNFASSETAAGDDLEHRLILPVRRRIPISCNFELLEVVLRYLYTNSICFCASYPPDNPQVPTTSNAEGLYELASIIKLKPLMQKSLKFLRASCNMNNIISRAFSPFAERNPEVGAVYDAYLVRNWKAVLPTEELAKTVVPPEDEVKIRRISAKFLELALKESRQRDNG